MTNLWDWVNKQTLFVTSELRESNFKLEKPLIKIIDFATFVFFTTESKSITFYKRIFLEDFYSQRLKSQIGSIYLSEGVSLPTALLFSTNALHVP